MILAWASPFNFQLSIFLFFIFFFIHFNDTFFAFESSLSSTRGGGPRVVVSTAAFHARVRGSVPGLGGL